MTLSVAPFDQRQLRDVLGTFVTGVTVVTTRDARGVAHGVTANSFSSVSLDPPLVLWSQALTSRSFEAFRDSRHFAVNILAHDQVALSGHFAKSREDKFNGVEHHDGHGGAPVLAGAAAHLECEQVAAYPSGDHLIYIGRVLRIGHANRRPLAFAGGRYMLANSWDLEASYLQFEQAPALPPQALRNVVAALPELAASLGEHSLCLAAWGNRGPVALHWEASRQPVSEHLVSGLVMPVTRSATGQAFAAFLPEAWTTPFIEEELRQFAEPGQDLDARREQFRAALDEVRQRGLARELGPAPARLHKTAVNTFSAPIRDTNGDMIMALTLAGSPARLGADWEGEVPRRLLAAAAELSRQLGHPAAGSAALPR